MRRMSTFLLLAVAASVCVLATSAEAQILRRRSKCCETTTICEAPAPCQTCAVVTPAPAPCQTCAVATPAPAPCSTCAEPTPVPAPCSTCADATPVPAPCNSCESTEVVTEAPAIQTVVYAAPIETTSVATTQVVTTQSDCCCKPTLAQRIRRPFRTVSYR